MSTVEDKLIAKYAAELQDIYDKQTAGQYTFTGVLAIFLREVDAARDQDAPAKAPESVAEPLNAYHVDVYRVASFSNRGDYYSVMRVFNNQDRKITWACSCPSWTYSPERNATGCKHTRRVYENRDVTPIRSYETNAYPAT